MPMKDVFIVEDPFNKYFGLVTCHECFLPTNDQKKPYDVVDIPNIDVRKYRKRVFPDSFRYSEVNTGRVPSPPLNVRIQQNYQDGGLKLYWDAPDDTAGGVTSYRVTRASPQLGFYNNITSYSGLGSPYIKDLTATVTSEYSYVVYASNTYGESNGSDPAFWPNKRVNIGVSYVLDGLTDVILDGDNSAVLDGASV